MKTELMGETTKSEYVFGTWGGGIKAAALSGYVKVMSQLGFTVPEIVIFEQAACGSAWSGAGGFTTGRAQLGTGCGKDLTFGMREDGLGGADVVVEAFKEYSWPAHVLRKIVLNREGRRRYAALLNRNDACFPLTTTHSEWGEYAASTIARGCEHGSAQVIRGRIVRLTPAGCRWDIHVEGWDGKMTVHSIDSMMITGQGAPIHPVVEPSARGFHFDGRDFYLRLDEIRRRCAESDAPILVYGAGETAGGILVELIRMFPGRRIVWVTPSTPLARAENADANWPYSDPEHGGPAPWSEMNWEEREAFIKKTDRGVVSAHYLSIIDRCDWIERRHGRIAGVERTSATTVRAIHVNGYVTEDAVAVVSAIGFDAWSFTEAISDPGLREELSGDANRIRLKKTVRNDFSLVYSGPPLIVPMLAGLAQGPGVPGLSRVGGVAQQVLEHLCSRRVLSMQPKLA